LEEVEVDDGLEEAETNDELEVVEEEAPEEAGLPVGSLGEEDPGVADDDIEKARLLAEELDGYLGTRERYHNQHILIPEGEYIVGSKAPKRNERPEQRVRLAVFYLGKFPVTNSLFEIFVEKTGYRTTAENQRYSTVYFGRVHEGVNERTGLVKVTFNATVRSETVHGACWHQPFGPGSTLYGKRNHPVVHVSLEDAMAFAAWTGKRLPTENEWEAAARTTNGYVFPWGDERKSNACNIEESAVADTTPVDKFTEFQNDFGIADILGNVLEWTLDTSEPSSHGKSNGGYQIVKGGSWISGNDICAFSRFKTDPASPSNIVGFRCVAY
jgi:formylglycine-generating enzyme required for sulfatase activity